MYTHLDTNQYSNPDKKLCMKAKFFLAHSMSLCREKNYTNCYLKGTLVQQFALTLQNLNGKAVHMYDEIPLLGLQLVYSFIDKGVGS